MRIARFVIFAIAATFFDAIVTVTLKEVGIQLGALPVMVKVAVCWGIVYVLVYHVFPSKKEKSAEPSASTGDKSGSA